MLNKKKLIEYFEKGIKNTSKLKIGTEHEKFILNKTSLKPLIYNEKEVPQPQEDEAWGLVILNVDPINS